MPDCPKSTLTVTEAQQRLAVLVEELRPLDQRLSIVAAEIALESQEILLADLRAGVETVREDLLRDAIESLAALVELTEDAAVERRLAVVDAVERLAAAA